jgi:Lon protease (S16) C-terminal proteolytic domain
MRPAMQGIFATVAALAALVLCHSQASAQVAVFADDAPSVQVKFARGTTEIGNLASGENLFTNRDSAVDQFPDVLAGLNFTKRAWSSAAPVAIDAPAEATVYVALGTGRRLNSIRNGLESDGWTKIGEIHFDDGSMAVYKQTFAQARRVKVKGVGLYGTIVLAQHLSVTNSSPADQNPQEKPKEKPADNMTRQGSASESISQAGPTTRLSKLQASIKALYVEQQDSGEMLGLAEDFILTATPGDPDGSTIPVSFTVPVDLEMHTVLADVCRALDTKYPHAEAAKYELSFADQFTPHGGGSIGAACATLFLSLIEGFDIDPNLAITGDVTADGRIRAIGGVAAKMRGAVEANCDIVVVPTDNYQQVVDAFIYEGSALLTKIQVLGVADLDDAASVARLDRAAKLKRAIDLFGEVQSVLKDAPLRVHDKGIHDKLAEIVKLEPNHFSAKLLLLLSENRAPKRMSPGTTLYYTNVAVNTMLPALLHPVSQPNMSINPVTPAIVEAGMKKLRKVRWYGDWQILPFVDATQDFMQAMLDFDDGQITRQDLEAKAHAVQDQADKLNTDRDLWEKMIREGP